MYRKQCFHLHVMIKLSAVASKPEQEEEIQVWLVCATLDAPLDHSCEAQPSSENK